MRLAHLALLILFAVLAMFGFAWIIVWLVLTPLVPPLAHALVEFVGWWLLGGLLVASAWIVAMRYFPAQRARYDGTPGNAGTRPPAH